MNIETDPTQQPNNPAEGADPNAGAAKPDGEASTETTPPDGQGNGEQAAAGDKPAEGDGPKEGEDTGAPEAYEAFTLPEGFALEGERLTKANEFFKANGMTQDQAQDAVNLFCELTGQDSEALTAALTTAQESARTQQITDWGVQSKTEFGEKYDAMVGDALYGVKALIAERPSLEQTFNDLGWGNHPDLIWAFHKFGASLREGGMETGTSRQQQGGEERTADRMYPNMPK